MLAPPCSAVDDPADLPDAQLRRPHAPPPQLSGQAFERVGVGDALALQLSVAAADERLQILFVPRQHLLDHAPGGAQIEVGGSVQVRHEIVQIRSHRAAMYALGRWTANTLPEIGQERAKMADAIVVGGGLAGLVAAAELADAGRRVVLLDQEPEGSLGGQAFWSLGGLFLVDSPEQRRMRIRDSHALAWQDWLGTAGFDRLDDAWPRRWAEAYVDFAAGEKRAWLAGMGVKFMPNV